MMAEPTIEGDMQRIQMNQILTGQDSNILKVIGRADAQMKHEQDKNGNDMENQGGERRRRIMKSRPIKRFKGSKYLLIKNAMHEEASEEDEAWLASRTEAELDMLVSIKKMAMERAKTIQDGRANGIFNFKLLRTIGLLLEEFVKERLKNASFLADVFETPTIPSEKDGGTILLEKDRECNHIEPIVKVELEEMTEESLKNASFLAGVFETPTILSEKDEGRILLEKDRECNHTEPIVKVKLEEMTEESLKNASFLADVFQTPTIPSEKDKGRILLEKDRECNHVEPIVKVEFEEMTARDDTKWKRNSCEQEEVYLKKRKRKRCGPVKAEF